MKKICFLLSLALSVLLFSCTKAEKNDSEQHHLVLQLMESRKAVEEGKITYSDVEKKLEKYLTSELKAKLGEEPISKYSMILRSLGGDWMQRKDLHDASKEKLEQERSRIDAELQEKLGSIEEIGSMALSKTLEKESYSCVYVRTRYKIEKFMGDAAQGIDSYTKYVLIKDVKDNQWKITDMKEYIDIQFKDQARNEALKTTMQKELNSFFEGESKESLFEDKQQ